MHASDRSSGAAAFDEPEARGAGAVMAGLSPAHQPVEWDDACSLCAAGGELLCCDGCPRTLHARCAGLTAVPEGLFGGLAALTSVDLYSCEGLTALPEGLFRGLTKLTSVNLHGCGKLTALPEGLFRGLTALTSVDLSDNYSLSTLPEGLADNANIHHIGLSRPEPAVE